MMTLQTKVRVEGMSAAEVFDFLANPDDSAYRAWWPGTHLRFHILKAQEGHVGDVIHMDEYIGPRRVRMDAVVVEAVPGRRLTWRWRRWVDLPARLSLQLVDLDDGVEITHTVQAGLRGVGRVLDPLLRLFLSPALARDLDAHVRTEFPLLRDRLRAGDAAAARG